MSLKSFLAKILGSIKQFFDKASPRAKWAVHTGATITENVKNFVESKAVDFVASIIPGDLDDKVVAFIRKEIPRIAINLRLIDEATAQGLTPDEIGIKLAETIKSIDADFRKDFYNTLAVRFAIAAADGRITWDEAQTTMKWYFDEKFKKGDTSGVPLTLSEAIAAE